MLAASCAHLCDCESVLGCACRLMNKGITHVLIVRSTLERRLDPKFPAELKYQIVEVRRQGKRARRKQSTWIHATSPLRYRKGIKPPATVVGGGL